MRFIFIILVTLLIQGCSEEQKSSPVTQLDENINPRLTVMNPKAWEGLPMSLVISDFKQSDGVFSSFICDEINKRLSLDLPGSLKELNSIDVGARTKAFNICFSAEAGDYSPEIFKSLGKYAKEYPQLVNEITAASR